MLEIPMVRVLVFATSSERPSFFRQLILMDTEFRENQDAAVDLTAASTSCDTFVGLRKQSMSLSYHPNSKYLSDDII